MARAAVRAPAEPALDLDDYLPYLVNRVGVRLVEAFTRELAPHGITLPMWRVLAVLAEAGARRQIDLAALTSIDPSTLSRLAAALQRRGLITRARSTESLRELRIDLTPRGRAIVRAVIPRALAHEDAAVRDLSARERDALKALLRRVYASLAG